LEIGGVIYPVVKPAPDELTRLEACRRSDAALLRAYLPSADWSAIEAHVTAAHHASIWGEFLTDLTTSAEMAPGPDEGNRRDAAIIGKLLQA
jgi:hypothetical protein